jgi:V/A-type H+/Na+-transporting ATPase subunit E
MKRLDTGTDKIQKICDSLRKETLDPARQEAREIVENAHLQAAEIVNQAQKKADGILHEAMNEMEERKRIFHSSLQLASRQGIEQIKQKIEKELFDKELSSLVEKETADPKLIAKLIEGFIRAMEENGVVDEFTAIIPKDVSPRSINELLVAKTLEKLENQTVQIGDFAGGIEVRLKKHQMTISISNEAVRELLAQYIRRDLRDLLFTR